MPRSVMTLDQLATSGRRLTTLRLLAAAETPLTSDQVMRRYVGGRAARDQQAAERNLARSALRDLRKAAWVERGDDGWRIAPAGREALAQIDALRAAA